MSGEIMRLDKWLSNLGVGSRKEVGIIIRKGFVTVNGEVIKDAKTKVSDHDSVVVDGEEISLDKYAYYMMNKPGGTLSATRDKKAATVLDLLPEEFQRPGLFPAGRLDKDTEGFLLITNDGDFAHKMLSPKNKISKTYLVKLDKKFEPDKLIKAFSEGVTIGDGEKTSSAELRIIQNDENPLVELVIYEGMFHQVKRMFALFDLEVIYLKRQKIGGLELDPNLKLGETRKIKKSGLDKIMEI